MRSIAKLQRVEIAVPDYSNLSRRGNGLTLRPKLKSKSGKPVHLVLDSTGLKTFGEGDWCQEKHKTKRKRRSWRKLHLGLDLVSGEIICSDLTNDDIGDPTALPDLLGQVDGPVDLFLAPFRRLQAKAYQAMDGAYDGKPTSDLLASRFEPTIEVMIPPPKNAISNHNSAQNSTARDRHIAEIAARGRTAWQKTCGYNQRGRDETLMGRWKKVIGPKLRARRFENQKAEAEISVRILNRMTGLGGPSFERTA